MSFIEYETWRIADGNKAAHHDMLRRWFAFVAEHHADLFPEWKSARYYRQVDHNGVPTGDYIMLFEFHYRKGHRAYKQRRKDWSGPYAEYKKVDPYQLFDPESVSISFWESQEENLWIG